MRQYEMTYLLSDKVSDNEMNAATGQINNLITKRKGKILGEENWGRRKLAYSINKQDFATYITLNFELDPNEFQKFNRDIRLNNDIVRSLIIVKDFGKETITLTADEIAETKSIEEVVGGERSFEAVEGATEESYDLMAKRDSEEQKEATEAISKDEEVEAKEEKAPEEDSDKKTSDKTNKDEKTELEVDANTVEEKNEEKTELVDQAEDSQAKPAKKAKKTAKTTTTKKKSKESDKKEEKKEEAKPKSESSKEKAEAEADRLAKLDEEIEGILGDDL